MGGGSLRIKSWEREKGNCDGCKSYNSECRMGACCICLYPKKKEVVRKKEVDDTG